MMNKILKTNEDNLDFETIIQDDVIVTIATNKYGRVVGAYAGKVGKVGKP